MSVFEQIHEHDYQQVVFCNHRASGLRAIIAIHDTTLGPALGGVRMRPFASEEEALEDVLRLARGMTYKAAISGVDLGGGKSVILGDPKTQKTEALLKAMGLFIHSLGGRYVAGQDIGTDSHDMAVLRAETPHVTCVHRKVGGAGDPSFATAYGVTAAIRAIVKSVSGNDSLEGRTIAVQGVGNVSYRVAKYCHEAGAKLVVTDVAAEPLEKASAELGAQVVAPEEIYAAEYDAQAMAWDLERRGFSDHFRRHAWGSSFEEQDARSDGGLDQKQYRRKRYRNVHLRCFSKIWR